MDIDWNITFENGVFIMNYDHTMGNSGNGGRTCETKPPLGIDPMDVWIERRVIALKLAIDRYKNAGVDVPIEWYDEYFELVNR